MTAPPVPPSPSPDNRIAGDSLATSYASASFAAPYVGTAKSVSVSGNFDQRH